MRWIFKSFLSGKGIQTISRELEAKQVPKLRGEPIWSKHGILYILTNERYAGNELFRKSYRTESIPFKKIDNFGEKTQFYAEDTHEAIVSLETFEKVQSLLREKKKKHGKKQSSEPFILTKMVFVKNVALSAIDESHHRGLCGHAQHTYQICPDAVQKGF